MGLLDLFSRGDRPRFDQQHPPGQSKGVLSWLRQTVGGWLGPRQSLGTPARAAVTSEKAAGGPRQINLPWFLPYIDDQTGETLEMRLAYRKMLADPVCKSAILSKALAVGALDLKVHPADRKSDSDRKIAKFIEYNLVERVTGGIPDLAWNVAGMGLVDGYSICEKVLAPEERGRYRDQIILKDLKPKNAGTDAILITDPFRNVVGVQGLRYNAGEIFSPSSFVLFKYLPVFGAPTGMSDFRAAYASYWMMDTAKKLRAIGLDKRSMPILLGTYSDPSVQPSLEEALRLARSQYWIAIPEQAKIEALNLAGEADAIFKSAIEDLRHDIYLGVAGAILQALEGETTDGRGNSEVHKSTADLFVWYLASLVQSLLNDRDDGLIKDLVDLNFVVEDYPKATLSAVNNAELLQELQIDTGLTQIGVPLSLEELYERYGRNPPADEADTVKPPPPGPGGEGGPEGGGGGGGLPFDEPEHDWEAMSDQDWDEFAAGDWQPHTVTRGPNKGKQAWKNAKSGAISYENPAEKAKARTASVAEKKKADAKAKQKAAKEKAAKPTVESVTAHAKSVLEKPTREGVLKLVGDLTSLKVAEMKQVVIALGVKGGRTKSDLAKKIAEKVAPTAAQKAKPVESVTAKPEPKKPQAQKPTAGTGAAPAVHQSTVRDAMHKLNAASGNHNLVSLVDLRKELHAGGMDRAAQDAAIKQLRKDGVLSATAIEGRHGTTQQERDAAIKEGDSTLGYLAFRPKG